VRAVNQLITNPTIQLGSSSSTPTLSLNNANLGDTNTILVGPTTSNNSEADVSARIRLMGTVRDGGTIEVGQTATDASQLSPAHLTVNVARDSSLTLGGNGEWLSLGGSAFDVNARGDNASFVNDGSVEAFGGNVRMNAPVSGDGIFVLGNNDAISTGSLEFRDSVASGERVRAVSGLLKLDQPLKFLGSIQEFDAGARIELAGTKATSLDFDPNDPGVLKVFDHQKLVAALDIIGNFTTSDFQLARQDGNTFVTRTQPSAGGTASALLADGTGTQATLAGLALPQNA
jgi:hypothetical protein